jgi:hypothetical protein
MDAGHTFSLEAKRAGLERLIAEETRRPAPDNLLIAQLKKQKLRLKEALNLQ